MQLTLAGEYALRAMIYVAEKQSDALVKISDISRHNKIPEKFLRKIIPLLGAAGLIKTQRGIGGGLSLAKPANEITPLLVIEAVEGEMALNRCLIDKEFCSNTRWCTVHTLWCEAHVKLRELLSSKSIAELVDENSVKKSELANSR
jgi:Rrf2 family transcriptional regulator, iron-sulfur cluster assembly transcription factor